MSRLLVPTLALLAACAPAPSTSSTERPAVRADLVLIPDGSPDDASLLVARYREWDADGQQIPNVELDHGHGPTDVDDDDGPVVRAQVGDQVVPVQAVDADGDRVLVDLDALSMGPQTLRITVAHGGLTSDELVVSILDRRLAPP